MNRAAAALLGIGAAIVVAVEFVVIGLMPAMTAELALSPAQAGALVTLFAFASALLGPVLVATTVRLRPALALAAALMPFAAGLLLLPFPSFAMVATLRVLQGATLPLFMSLAGARLAADRGAGQGIALLYIGVTIGGTLAPTFGAFAAERVGWVAPMAGLGALALVAAAACLALPHRTLADERGMTWRLLARAPMPAHLLLSALLFATMFAGFSYVALLLTRAGLDADAVTIALLGFGAAGLAGNWLVGRFARWALPATYALALVVVLATSWLSFVVRPGALALALAMLIWGVAHSAGFVFSQVRVMAVAPEAPGFAGALNISAANIGIAIGSLAGGRAIEWGGPATLAATMIALALPCAGVAFWIGRAGRPLPG
jgi:predicted MFS family arabinose efflux permease